MPVTGLYLIQDSTTPSAINILTDRLSKLHQPIPLGRWSLEHRLLRENAPPPPTPTSNTPQKSLQQQPPAPQHKLLQLLDLSYHPFTLFVLADKQIVTSDREFDFIVKSKMASMWALRQTLRAAGLGYEVDDFRVRIADLAHADQNVKGVIMEVEYTPCSYIEQGEAIIRDFVMGLQPPDGKFTFAPSEGYEPGREWTVLDTGRQYFEVFRFR